MPYRSVGTRASRCSWLFVALLAAFGLSACGSSAEDAGAGSGSLDRSSIASTGMPAATTLSPTGPWFTDEQGRVVVIHGINMVNKFPPYSLESIGFGERELRFLAENGFNAIRLGFAWAGVEPSPGVYDDAHIDSIVRTGRLARRFGMIPMLEFHQDFYSFKTGGNGAPDWAVISPVPVLPIGDSYGGLINAQQPFQSFWDNAAAPDGLGLQEHFAAAWKHVAERLKNEPGVTYEILNEPYAGSYDAASCLLPVGCPLFDIGKLWPFYQKVLAAIREVDATRMVLVEPQFVFGAGARSWLPSMNDDNVAFAFHDYCIEVVLGFPQTVGCDSLVTIPLINAEAHYAATGEANIMNEFGAAAAAPAMESLMADADSRMLSWAHWAYWASDAQAPQTYGIVADFDKGPYGDNVKQDLLAVLNRPFPRVVAGTPQAWKWDPSTKTFTASYSSARADGNGSFANGAISEFFINPRYYPAGYKAAVSGGTVASPANAPYLRVAADATSVTVIVTSN